MPEFNAIQKFKLINPFDTQNSFHEIIRHVFEKEFFNTRMTIENSPFYLKRNVRKQVKCGLF